MSNRKMMTEWESETSISFTELVESWLYDAEDPETLAKWVSEWATDLFLSHPQDLSSTEVNVVEAMIGEFENTDFYDEAMRECAYEHSVGELWDATA